MDEIMMKESVKEGYTQKRANEILDVVMAFARMEFQEKINISDKDDVFDAIGTGVNMLGEELEGSVVSLREKEHLLKEVHHRVKNNLQIISSLLNLQSENIKDKKFLSLIQESKNRIYSMALIHEMLYRSKDLSRVEIGQYIERLCKSVYQSYSLSDHRISFEFDVEAGIFFEIDRMIPIGLLLNEIVSNSLKYAFPSKTGVITVVFKKKNNGYLMDISDNGVGLKEIKSAEEAQTLGIQLVYMLSEQLSATVVVDGSNGTKYSFRFS